MTAIFVHVSDIHFGQEKHHFLHIHGDVKQQLIADARHVIRNELGGVASGILVTGDIAHSGVWKQYEDAGAWLDKLANEVGCPIERVQMVPGNHDLDRSKLSIGAKHVLDVIRAGGAAEYEMVIANDVDRASLFARFEDYGRFCYGYQCDLDENAKFATNLLVELAPGRSIRFIRMNSALLCTGDEKEAEPELMVGEGQFTLPRVDGEENVVLIHHPLNWYKDREEVTRYISSRSRVFISGHEHEPNVEIDTNADDSELMRLAAGATVAFKSDDEFTFTYNIIEFSWDPEPDALAVTIHPRAWNPVGTCFEADEKRLGGKDPRFSLNSPNFRKSPKPVPEDGKIGGVGADEMPEEMMPVVELVPADVESREAVIMPPSVEGYDLVMLHFFRDLYESERLHIFGALNALPLGSDEQITRTVERKLFDWLARSGKLADVERMMREMIAARENRGA